MSESVFLNIMYFFFKLIGLAPFTIKKDKLSHQDYKLRVNHSYKGNIYNCLLIIFALYLSFLTYQKYLNYDFPKRSDLSPHFLLVKALIGLFSLVYFWTIICFKQNNAVKIYHKFVEVDKSASQTLKQTSYYLLKKDVAVYCSINLFLWISIIITDVFVLGSVFKSTWLIMRLPRFIGTWFLVQYGFIANFQKKRFQEVNNSFRCLADNIMMLDEVIIVKDFRYLKNLYNSLYEMTLEISSYYSLPTFVIITYFCETIIYTTYYFFSPFIRPTKNYSFLLTFSSILYLSMQIFPIIILTNNITSLRNEIQFVRKMVYNLMEGCINHKELLGQINKASTYLCC